MLRRIWFLAIHEVRCFLRYRPSLIWMFGMPLFFMWTSGMMSGGGRSVATRPRTVRFEVTQPGPVVQSLTRYLEAMKYQVRLVAPGVDTLPADLIVVVPDSFEAKAGRGVACDLTTRTGSNDDRTSRLHHARLMRAVVRTLGDLATLAVRDSAITGAGLQALAARPAAITLDSSPAFAARKVPTGYEQSVPGTLVMFMLMVLMTGGIAQLFEDRKQGLLRRLASSPLTRREIVASRIVARTLIGLIMALFALIVGRFLFQVDWGGTNAPFAVLLLLVYALAISGIAVLFGSLARSEAQAISLGVIISIVASALGGCWWPIEIVPRPMQALSLLLPTGWAMQGLHRLMELGQPPAAAWPSFAMLGLYALVMLLLAARKFRFD